MTRPFTRLLRQTVVYWETDSTDVFGNTSWEAGIEIKARWEEQAEDVLNADGENVVSKAVVYVDGDQDIVMDGVMFLGVKSSLTTAQIPDPDRVANAYRIIAVRNSPELRNRRSLKKLWLK